MAGKYRLKIMGRGSLPYAFSNDYHKPTSSQDDICAIKINEYLGLFMFKRRITIEESSDKVVFIIDNAPSFSVRLKCIEEMVLKGTLSTYFRFFGLLCMFRLSDTRKGFDNIGKFMLRLKLIELKS